MKIKKILLSFVPGDLRNRLAWKVKICLFLRAHPWARKRTPGEYLMAKDFFLNYHARPLAEQKAMFEQLTSSLDLDSRQLAETILNRQKHLFTHNIISQKKLFTPEERKMQKIYYREIGQIRRRYLAQEFPAFSSESFVFWSGLRFLPEKVQARLQGGIFIDGGAYNGDSSLAFSHQYQPHAIYAFEPEKNNFESLTKNTKGDERIKPINKGLGDGSLETAAIIAAGASSQIKDNQNESATMSLISLDQFVREQNIDRIDCIKLDLEGYEQPALRGMEESIRKWKPILAISIYHNTADFFGIRRLIDELGLGYHLRIVKANPLCLAQEVLLLAYHDYETSD